MQTLYCTISGIPLLSMEPLSGGVWPLVTKFEQSIVHPIYDLPAETVLAKLANLLNQAEHQQYQLSENAEQQLCLAASATLNLIGCLVKTAGKSSGLPLPGIIIGSGSTLLTVAKWHSKLVKKPALPRYRPTESWTNFSAWTEAVKEIHDTWHSNKNKEVDSLQEAIDGEATIEKVYKKIDKNKVFNWITEQCKHDVAIGRLATMQSMFCADLINPLDWLQDDVDDLTEIISKYCDPTHDIMHYVMTHCNAMRATIRDYNSGFTLLTSFDARSALIDESPEQQAKEREAATQTMSSFKGRVKEMTAAPALPVRNAYKDLASYLKASAEYRILAKLWATQNSSK